MQDLRDGADEQRLRQPGHALEQAMPTAKKGHEQLLDNLPLTDDHAANLLGHLLIRGGEFSYGLGFRGERRVGGRHGSARVWWSQGEAMTHSKWRFDV